MPKIHKHFCQFCGLWLGEGSALCKKCKRPMCANCVVKFRTPPQDDELYVDEVLVYNPAFRKGTYKCFDCREARAERILGIYRTWEDPPSDPIEWVWHFTAQDFDVDLPELPNEYDAAEALSRVAHLYGCPSDSVPTRDGTVLVGWEIPDGVTREYHEPAFRDSVENWELHPCNVVVTYSGGWVALYKPYRDPLPGIAHRGRGSTVKVPDDGSRNPDIYTLNPTAFLEAARECARPQD